MASDWEVIKLSDFVDIKTGFPFKSKQYLEHDEGYKLLRGDNVVQGAFRWANVKLWSKDELTEKQKGYFLEEGDVILAMDRPWIEAGLKTAQITSKDLPCLLVQRVARLQAKNNEDQDFLRYLVSSYWFVEYLKLVQTGTAIPHISTKQILSYETKIPPLIERKNIGRLLRSLDDKIELNRQMNETLEAMAQALFKSWFVDFDPVIDNALAAGNAIPDELLERAEQRKKIERKDNSDIQGLFPDEFEFTEELGWIPKGWEVGSLDKMFELQRGFDLPKKKRTDGIYPLMAASGQDGTHNEFKVKGPNVVTGRSGKLGVVSFVHTNHWPLNTTLWVKNYDKSNPYHAYFFLQTLDLDRYNSGSAVPSLNRNNVHNLVQILPSKVVLDKFQEVVESNFAKIAENNSGIEILTKLRDTLLPKLMSGELRIPDDIL